MSDRALVSIIIPTYNHAHLISESIQSVVEQTYQHWELIIIDDGSTDDTENIVGKFRDSRIQYHYIEHSGFVGVVRNHGIRKAKGEYIAFHDSDDLWRKDKLDFQLDLFKQYPEGKFILSNGEIFGTRRHLSTECENLFVGSLFWPILKGNRFVYYTPSLIFRSEVVNETGLLNENMASADMEFFLKMSDRYPGIFTNERLIKVRKHDHNSTEMYGIDQYLSSIKMVTEFYKKGSLQKKQFVSMVSLYYYKMGLHYITISQPQRALWAFWNYVKLTPLQWKGWVRLMQATILYIKS